MCLIFSIPASASLLQKAPAAEKVSKEAAVYSPKKQLYIVSKKASEPKEAAVYSLSKKASEYSLQKSICILSPKKGICILSPKKQQLYIVSKKELQEHDDDKSDLTPGSTSPGSVGVYCSFRLFA